MTIEVCDVPTTSALDQGVVAAAYFRDAYRVGIKNTEASVIDIFFSIFGHHPMWMKQLLIVRNIIAAACGLDVPSATDILRPQRKASYAVGDKIGPWPIFFVSETELIAGRNNQHLDFRLSVLREGAESRLGMTERHKETSKAVISTICTRHNIFGKVYLLFIVPFHKRGVQNLIARAQLASRL
jgi:hypothetical protein